MVIRRQRCLVLPIVTLCLGFIQKSIHFTMAAETSEGRSEELDAAQQEAYDSSDTADPRKSDLVKVFLLGNLTTSAVRTNCCI